MAFPDNKDVVTVDEQGFIQALEEGTAVVRATTIDGRSLYAECKVTVTKRTFELNMSLSEGWNWISTNLSGAEFEQANSFINPIQANLYRLVGFDTELIKDNQLGFVGQLEKLSPEACYLAQMTSSINYSWTGYIHEAEDIPIRLKKGWNWIGYVPIVELSLEDAFKNLTLQEGDVIKGYDQFAIYENGKWHGDLKMMIPGHGYMFYSHQNATFYYPTKYKAAEVTYAVPKVKTPNKQTLWMTVKHKYPHNMTLIAEIRNDGEIIQNDNYMIGAFVEDECRGIGQYIDDRIFITIYGDIKSSERICFRAYEYATKKEFAILENCYFNNSMLGTLSSPFALTLDKTTEICDILHGNMYDLYIDPTDSFLYLDGDGSKIKSVTIISNNGSIVYHSISNPKIL